MSDDCSVENGETPTPDRSENDFHCSPDENAVAPLEEADNFSPPADAEPPAHQPPPAPPAPLFDGSASRGFDAAAYEKPKKGGSFALRAVILALCVLVLIAAAAMIFTGGADTTDTGLSKSGGGSDSDDYDSYTDFFDAYYSSDNVSGVTGIETTAADAGLSLELSEKPEGGELELTEIYSKCAPAVVGITAGTDGSDKYWGTGIIFREDGYIITNFHIIDGASNASVVLSDETEYEALLIGYDSDSDLAVLKIEAEGLTAAEFGDSSLLKTGEAVVAIGNPLGAQFTGTMTDGIISAIDRDVDYNGHTMTLLQTNAAINEGNSGGPLINMYGQVIGITNMKMISSYSSIEGIGFAIPSRSVKEVVDELLEQGYVTGRPVMGITVGAITAELAAENDIPEGLYISEVAEGSSAYERGVKKGDILTAVDGEAVSSTSEVNAILETRSVGDEVTLSLYRDGEALEISITLLERGVIYGS